MAWDNTEDILTDLVILGRAAPEEMRDGRQTVCTGAWSPEKGFIRLYPISPEDNLFSRWDVVNVEVERNSNDMRHESWKIKGRKRNQREKVEIIGQYPREKWATLMHNLENACVNEINEAKRSLGIISPESINLYYEDWEDDDHPSKQSKLLKERDELKPDNRGEFDKNIKIKYTCPDCTNKQGYHDHPLLAWEAYMGQKNTSSCDELADNFRFNDKKYCHWFFVGNMNQFKRSFMVISVIRVKDPVIYNHTFEEFPKVADDFIPANEH